MHNDKPDTYALLSHGGFLSKIIISQITQDHTPLGNTPYTRIRIEGVVVEQLPTDDLALASMLLRAQAEVIELKQRLDDVWAVAKRMAGVKA